MNKGEYTYVVNNATINLVAYSYNNNDGDDVHCGGGQGGGKVLNVRQPPPLFEFECKTTTTVV